MRLLVTRPEEDAVAFKAHLIALHEIDVEDAELFLTATDPELLLKQVERLLAQSGTREDKRHIVSNEGHHTRNTETQGGMREFARNLFRNNE